MKKILCVLLLLFATSAWAAESITWEIVEYKPKQGGYRAEVTSTIATAADGSVTSTQLGGTAGGNGTRYDMRGRRLWGVCVGDNGTNPTDNSDLYLRQGSASGRDILGLAGENTIDSGASLDNNCFKPQVAGDPMTVPVFDNLYQVVSNNVVDSAQIIIKYQFVE